MVYYILRELWHSIADLTLFFMGLFMYVSFMGVKTTPPDYETIENLYRVINDWFCIKIDLLWHHSNFLLFHIFNRVLILWNTLINTLCNRTINNQTNMCIVLLSLTVALFRSFFCPFFGMWLSLSRVWRYDKTGSLKKRIETYFTEHSSLQHSITHDKKKHKKIKKIGRNFSYMSSSSW